MHHKSALAQSTGTLVKLVVVKDMKRKIHWLGNMCVWKRESGVERKQFVSTRTVDLLMR